jgi:hypothetical protein
MGHSMKKATTPALVRLTPADVHRLSKPKSGFDAYAQALVALLQAKASVLHVTGVDAEIVLDELEAYQALQPVVANAERQAAMARETRLLHASNVWRAMLKIYQHAQLAAENDAEVEDAVAAFETFLKRRRAKTPPAPPAAPTA